MGWELSAETVLGSIRKHALARLRWALRIQGECGYSAIHPVRRKEIKLRPVCSVMARGSMHFYLMLLLTAIPQLDSSTPKGLHRGKGTLQDPPDWGSETLAEQPATK